MQNAVSSFAFIAQFVTFAQFMVSLVIWLFLAKEVHFEFKSNNDVIEEDLKWLFYAITYWVVLCFWLWRSYAN